MSRAAGAETRDWVADLAASDSGAISELRSALLRGLRRAIGNSAGDAQLEDFAQEATIRVLASLDTFRGESQFLSWALSITMRVAYTEMRRAHYRNVSLDAASEAGSRLETPAAGATAEQILARERLATLLRGLIATDLTERQRTALQAELSGMPIGDIAARMDTSRGALYKLLHDARLRLKASLEAKGIGPDEVAAAWQ